MSRYKFSESVFGIYKTIILSDEQEGNNLEVTLHGGTPLRFKINLTGKPIDILDGFATAEELSAAKGARCWIMMPFANRIPGGTYIVNGTKYFLDPVPPRNEVIHGFTSYETFAVKEINITGNFIEAVLIFNKIRPGVFKGYPFSLDIELKYKLEPDKLTITVTANNSGKETAPFAPGWHPYFKTSEQGIEDLVFTLNADKIILLNDKNIPLDGNKAFANLNDFPMLDFRESILKTKRKINGRVLDNCFSNLKIEEDGYSRASIFNPDNELKITMFQKDGVTLAFTGDTLAQRKRNSIAIEPMKFITNAFNRNELTEEVLIKPGEKSEFEFGVEISN